MDTTRPTLPQRVTAVLRARQYIVFFSIGLFALDVAVPILSAWMHRGEPFSELMYNSWGPLADSVATRSVLIGAVWVAYVLVMTWLRAGYIRSLVGRLHLRPASGRQFLNLLVFEVFLEVVGALGVWGLVEAGQNVLAVNLVAFVQLVVYLVVLYADYIIVLADVGPLGGIRLSWRMVRLTMLPSAGILLVVSLAGQLSAGLLGPSVVRDLGHALPMLFVQVVLMGALIFVADVVLVVLYLRAVESGRLKLTRGAEEADTEGVSPSTRG
jgi:hypothetical protein